MSECLRPLGTGRVKFSLVASDGDLTLVSLRRRNSEGEETGETCSSGRALWEGNPLSVSECSSLGLTSDRFSGTVGVGLIDL